LYKIFITILLILSSLYAQDETENDYTLGEGIQIASLPIYIGGYFSLDYRHTKQEDRYRINNIALLSYGNYNKFSYIAEVEYKKFYVQTIQDTMETTKQDHMLLMERLYLDYNINQNYMLRVGKYNSPIGYWNLLPVNVLRDTTSSPVTSSIIFPQYTTGVDVSYTSYDINSFKIDLMFQNNTDLDARYNNYEIDEHYGVGITYEKENLSFKLNAGYFNLVQYHDAIEYRNEFDEKEEEEDSEEEEDEEDDEDYELKQPRRYYALLAARYDSNNFQIMSEIGTQRTATSSTTSYAAYIQGLYRFNNQHMAILRAESYQEDVLNKSDNMAIVGYTYRPIYPVAFKTEYQIHSLPKNDIFIFSFSMMF